MTNTTEETTDEQLWGAGLRDLEEKLSEHYGVERIWLQADYYHEARNETLYEVLTYFDGEEEHFIADDVPVFGHDESGAVGILVDDLPPKEMVADKVEEITGGA